MHQGQVREARAAGLGEKHGRERVRGHPMRIGLAVHPANPQLLPTIATRDHGHVDPVQSCPS